MRRRLTTLVAATTALVALAFVLPLALLVRELAADRALRPAELATRTLAPAVALQDDRSRTAALVDATAAGLEGPVGAVLPDGTVIGASPPEGIVERVREEARAARYRVAGGEVVVVPVVADDGTGLVHAVVPDVALRRGVTTAWLILAGLGAVLVGGATALADVLARRTLASIAQVEHLAQRLADGDLAARATVDDPPEVARVATVLGGLAQRVDQLLEAEREAAADLSHRLRTPLTPLRIDAEALPASVQRERLLADVRAVEDEVTGVIRSFRVRGQATPEDRADPVAVTRDRVAFWQPLAEDQGRAATLELPSPAPEEAPIRVRLPADRLAEALDVLLGNVFAHTPEGAALAVGVRSDVGEVVIEVVDEGPGWPADLAVGERGASGSTRTTGLGLDIARRAAEDAGGRLVLDRGARGGARAALHLPAETV